MAVVAAAMMLFLGLLFLLSGLVVNFLQALSFVALRLFWKRCYRRVNRVLVELVWIQLVWLVDWWARVDIKLYVDDEAFESMGKEHALVIANHRSDIDWLVGWVLAQRCGCLGSSLAIMKKSIKFLPVIGWSMWFSEYLFLERNWTKDKNTLKSGLQGLRDFPCPFWLALFVEGTRFTEAKLLAAQEYAISQGLPVPRNVLIPRTKGFVSSVSNMRELVPAVYDCTVVIPEDSPRPTFLRLFSGKSSVVHVHMRRYAMEELPETDEGLSQWCKDVFVAKDAFLDQHSSEGGFDEQEYKPIGRPVKSLLVVIFWSILMVFSAYEIFKWSSLLSTWQGIAFLIGGLVLVTGIMYVLILFSQSEHSTLAKVSAPEQTASTNSGKALQKRLLPIALNFVKLD